jgi:hypothetical protein
MKNAKNILNHMFTNPKVNSFRCLNILKSLLPNRLTDFISYMYKKQSTIYIVINQYNMKMEFEYKKNLIQTLANDLATLNPKCSDLKDNKIKINILPKKLQKSEVKYTFSYKERAKGEFKNILTNQEHYKIIEKIRQNIKKTTTQ